MSALNQSKTALESGKTTLIKLSAPGCGPCKHYAYIFESTPIPNCEKHSLDISDDEVYAWMKSITKAQSVPVTLLFRNGNKVAEHVGVMNAVQLVMFCGAHV